MTFEELVAQATKQAVQSMVDRGVLPGYDSDPKPFSEKTIAVNDGASTQEASQMARTVVSKDRNKWRVTLVDLESGKKKSHIFATEEEARAAAPRLIREYKRPIGVPVSEALATFVRYLEVRGNRPRSIEGTVGRIESVIGKEADTLTGEITSDLFATLWERFTMTVTRLKRTPSINTQSSTLVDIKSFFKWCATKGWVKSDPVAEIRVIGRRKRGKLQFVGRDESRKFLAKALERAEAGDVGAAAVAIVLVMGMRASEICDRIVKELDDNGRILVITASKTETGIRRLQVPELLIPVFARLVQGKGPEDRILGNRDRFWLREQTIRVCKLAGVSVLTTHGLRGTHASLAVEAGVAGVAVAASLGHDSFTGMTAKHYATPTSVEGAKNNKVAAALGAVN